MNYFESEKAKGEDGSRFGIVPDIYELLAECCISLSQVAGVEPVLLQDFPDRPGAVCTLYGKKAEYLITIEVARPPELFLESSPLDSEKSPERLFSGRADLYRDWLRVNHLVLVAEEVDCQSWEEVQATLAKYGIIV